MIALSALGVFTAHRSASQPPTQRYVVASKTIHAGQLIEAEDLSTVALDLPGDIASIKAADARSLVGRVASSAVGPLELIAPADVFDGERFLEPDAIELALDLPAARALHGTISSGSVVDVLSTDPNGSGTEVLASRVRVTAVDEKTKSGIGSSGAVRVRLSVDGSELATRIIDASLRADTTLVLPRPAAESRP